MSWSYPDLQKWIASDIVETVRTLRLEGTMLTTIPDSISRLTNLHELDISNNYLKTLPDSISLLTNLRELMLWGNRLTSLAVGTSTV